MTQRLHTTALTFGAMLLLLSGCATVENLWPGKQAANQVAVRPEKDVDGGRALIEAIGAMQVDSASTQAELAASARAAVAAEPTVANRLRYAAYLALPGQPAADPVAARRQLSEILARPELLRPLERVVATILLEQVDERLVLESEANRLRQDLANRDKERSAAVPPKRNPSDAEEIARLKRALDEAQHKLDAVIQVERSILGRGNPPKP